MRFHLLGTNVHAYRALIYFNFACIFVKEYFVTFFGYKRLSVSFYRKLLQKIATKSNTLPKNSSFLCLKNPNWSQLSFEKLFLRLNMTPLTKQGRDSKLYELQTIQISFLYILLEKTKKTGLLQNGRLLHLRILWISMCLPKWNRLMVNSYLEFLRIDFTLLKFFKKMLGISGFFQSFPPALACWKPYIMWGKFPLNLKCIWKNNKKGIIVSFVRSHGRSNSFRPFFTNEKPWKVALFSAYFLPSECQFQYLSIFCPTFLLKHYQTSNSELLVSFYGVLLAFLGGFQEKSHKNQHFG